MPQTKSFQLRSNAYIFDVMKSLYENYSEKEVKKVQKRFNAMLNAASENPNPRVGMIEQILMKAYWGEISKSKNKEQNLDELRILLQKLNKLLVPPQFQTIIKQVRTITKHNFQVQREEN